MHLDQAEKDNAREVLRVGKATKFWQLICDSLDDSITHLREELDGDDIEDLTPEQYKLTSELLKSKIKFLKKLQDTPDNLIVFLTEPAGNTETPQNFDPYFTPAQIDKKFFNYKSPETE